MTTFVLVHGAWGGSYGFKYVRGPLRAAGHEVFTPSLTGIGERAHLASPQVNLTTHVTDVVNTILYEDLTDIVLLGYSYGGMVVTGALEHVADRVAHLVYLDAFKPADGQSLRDLTGAPYGAPRSGRAASGWCEPLYRPLEDERRSTGSRPGGPRTRSAASPSRSGWRKPLEEFPFTRTYVKALQEPRGRRGHRGQRVLAGSGVRQGRPGLAVPGDRHRPHDPDQPPG